MRPILISILLASAAAPAIAADLPVMLRDGAAWTPVSADALPGSPPEVAQGRSFPIPATVAVDDALVPGPVLNKDEVRAEFVRRFPTFATEKPAILDASSKAMIASELIVVSRAQGLNLDAGKIISADTEMPNPLGNVPMRAVQTARLESLDKKAGRAVVEWRQVLDPAAFKASIEAMLLNMGKDKISPEKLEEARAVFASASMQSETICRHEIDIHSGLAVAVECRASDTITVQGKTQHVEEHWRITQTKPEPA
ncbi:hypothetical protein [Phenylobacterium sp.]|jgi:hypothetical protein|uniref:hypothetical protein n=1 Tax=Phenylobacterium sp. TaxID=1871053 RepID=UPI002E319911|nr:hypothetical protein [Phenylobacterium sp.]HEX3367684.1 hypothetical protein [Phenylobacterium sp.]